MVYYYSVLRFWQIIMQSFNEINNDEEHETARICTARFGGWLDLDRMSSKNRRRGRRVEWSSEIWRNSECRQCFSTNHYQFCSRLNRSPPQVCRCSLSEDSLSIKRWSHLGWIFKLDKIPIYANYFVTLTKWHKRDYPWACCQCSESLALQNTHTNGNCFCRSGNYRENLSYN